MIYKKELVKEKITVNRDAITGNKLNHNCEVVIFESIGRKLVLFLITDYLALTHPRQTI